MDESETRSSASSLDNLRNKHRRVGKASCIQRLYCKRRETAKIIYIRLIGRLAIVSIVRPLFEGDTDIESKRMMLLHNDVEALKD